jgi:hypothetical protein
MHIPANRIFKLNLTQLLMLDPTAYVNLCLMFPHGAKSLDEIPTLTLPDNYLLALVLPRDIVLLTKSPPTATHWDKKKAEWVKVDEIQQDKT